MNETFEFRLLNEFQRDFPLCPAPFAELAARLGVAERVVLGGLEKLRREGKISRVGAVFAPKRIGASTLAAMAVPAEQLDAVAAAVNRFPEVNHNYEREHHYNLWFVVTAGSEGRLQATLGAIEQAAGYPLMPLPLVEEFHIDLGFSLNDNAPKKAAIARPVRPAALIDEAERRLVAVLQEGLPLFMRPFAMIAERIGASESDVLGRIGRWLDDGAIKRFGVVVRHHELGFRANAMVVHDIPDDRVSEIGRALAEEPAVTLCYRRPRHLPDWPYNLFCMIHGRERAEVESLIADLRLRHGLEACAHETLFSLTRFKQNGARYA
ncbi:Lrp/AsnC family transcriptional regulator [Dechloromonas denitrificans]|uniref:siroheme decarboxylase subunit beta n=1 Tax=Dechloromonas denitrificans TaxID=281362 RepID=UPI001CF846FE|nr:Lrp/AsnC family transcriptional regulator [Dechloromonas denitrificans]UCV12420.1 Lrp/AsnC family transcriptional regulator [Dechloromonas denitrificans]